MRFPTLYKKTSTGKIQEWNISVLDHHPGFEIVTRYGQTDGAKTTATDLILNGKNIGRANETTAYEQAVSEAQSQWEKKKKNKGYVESIEDAEKGVVDALVTGGADVMLAQSYSKHSHKIQFPCYVQPKLDGHRCVAIVQDGVCTLWSRTRKPIKGVPHIQRKLERIFASRNIVLDGELYNHDFKDRFEELTSFIRQETPKPGHEVVEYWVYDIINEKPFYERCDFLSVLPLKGTIQSVETFRINEEMLSHVFTSYTEEGYEGVMLRNVNSLYVGKRSYDLQKVKEFDDAEFEIVGIESGRGKMSDKGVFVCKSDSGEYFRAKMMGSLDDLADLVDNPENYIGKMVTVKFQGLTKYGIPRFPVAIRMREDI